MKTRSKKLNLNRETLHQLRDNDLGRAVAGLKIALNQSIQSGETYCWCTDGCEDR